TLFGSVDAERRTKNTRVEVHGFYAYSETKHVLTTRKGFGRAQFSYYFWHPLYGYVGKALEYNHFQDLRLRSRAGGGLGWAIVERKDLVARIEGGLEYVNEQFYDSGLNNAYAAVRGAGHFEWQVIEALRLSEDIEYLASTKDLKSFITRSVSSANL